MKKIIHLSDLHIGYQNCALQFNTLVDSIIFTKTPASDYVVVVTGDLVDDANVQSSYSQAKHYLDKLKQAGFTVLVVPGNHDYGTGMWASKEYVSVFKETFFNDVTVSYPKLDIIEDIAFIGLDSMAEELDWPDNLFAEGELGQSQLQRLKDLLNQPHVKECVKKVVYLHHHPFDPQPFHQLKDSENLKQIIEGRIDALLFGHNHAGKVWNGIWHIPRCYDAGTATGKENGCICWRVIDLARDPRLDYSLA